MYETLGFLGIIFFFPLLILASMQLVKGLDDIDRGLKKKGWQKIGFGILILLLLFLIILGLIRGMAF
ncbi:hypothetical protein ACFLQ6_04865 [Thermoproteota archaeon]